MIKNNRYQGFTLLRSMLPMLPMLLAVACNSGAKQQHSSAGIDSTRGSLFEEQKVLDTTVVTRDGNTPFTEKYVISRTEVALKQAPSMQAKTMEKAHYGDSFEVIEDLGEWLAVWSKERYPFAGEHDGKPRVVTASRKIFIPKAAVGGRSALKLYVEDAKIVTTVTPEGRKSRYEEQGFPLSEYLDITLITANDYRVKKAERYEALLLDTVDHPKVDGKLVLKTKAKELIFNDSPPEAEETRADYCYIGQIPALESYVVSGNYYESSDYKLIDKNTGKTQVELEDYPLLSPDGKHLLSFHADPYEMTEEVAIYSIQGAKISKVVSLSFKHWMGSVTRGDVFFSKDGAIYLPVAYNKIYWSEDGHIDSAKQFMKVTLLK
ncbi:hypothetical protein ACL9RF_09840 [Sphingobacterium sp. Mn56C]|uniref:hypothetical protein n=1 Tax=Sphingobacterium sp. Mn56C TaxID=3395261 RepID=UPI003BD84724